MKKWRVMNREAICLQLADKINHLKNNDKIISERLAGIRLLYGVEPGPRTPVMYQPGIIFLFSGHKIGYINKRKFRYDANEYLLLTVPLPFECETWATPEVPLAGIRLDIDVLQLQELLMDIGEDERFQLPMAASGINSATLSDEDFMCGGKIAGCDGAPAGCADSGKTDYSRNSLSCADGAARRGAACAG